MAQLTSDAGTALLASAGHDANIIAGVISNSANNGQTLITARNNINLGTVSTASANTIVWDANNRHSDSQSTDQGSQINTRGSLTLQAGNDFNAKAAGVNATGALQVTAGHDVNITAGSSSQTAEDAHQHTSKGFLSSSTVTTLDSLKRTQAVGSDFGGSSVNVASANNLQVLGSNVVSDHATNLSAKNNITIAAASNTEQQTHNRQKTSRGLLSSGGIGFTVGTREQAVNGKDQTTTAAASTVGSTSGNVIIMAGQNYKQVGSDVLTPGGDVNILAKDIKITEARETSASQTEQKFSQSGLTVALTSPVLSAVQSGASMSQAASNTSNGRMKALAGASAGLAGYGAYTAIDNGQGSTINGKEGQIATGKDANGTPTSRDATAADKMGGINLSISVGGSRSQSTSENKSDSARGSSLNAGGNVFLTATGAGENSNFLVQGSGILAGNIASLTADNQVNLQAANNTASQTSNNTSSSGSIGLSVGSSGFGVTASASKGRGNADGADTSHTNSHIEGNTVNLKSSGDSTIKGAVIAGNTVNTNIGGNLNIESVQDSSTYVSKQQSLGASVTVGAGFSGSISASKSNANSNFASVTEQSDIKAGDGGFDVKVKGNTDLKGGAITSTPTAIDGNKNSFNGNTTEGLARLSTSDIQNQGDYSANSVGISVGSSGGSGAGLGQQSGSAASTTKAAISGIAGNQAARTGDQEAGIGQIFDADKVMADVNAQTQITQSFGQQASKAVGDYAGGQVAKASQLSAQAAQEPDSQKKADLQAQADAINANWVDSGTLRLAAHAVIGGLTGGVNGATGAAAGTLTAPTVAKALSEAGVSGPVATTITALAATAAGAAVGGTAGAVTANNEVMNNYLNHNRPSMLRLSEKEKYDTAAAGCASGDKAACGTRDELAQRSAQRDNELTKACAGSTPDLCNSFASQATAMGNTVTTLPGGFTYANSPTSSALNTATIGAPTRPDSFHDTAAKSTSEAIVLEVGNQAAGAVIGAAIVGGKTVVGAIKGAASETAAAGSKTSASEFIPAPNQYGQVAKDYGEFGTLGLTNVDPMRLPDGVKMVNLLRSSGLSYDEAIIEARRFISSGSTPPVATPLEVTDKLVKVVPAGGQPSNTTGYWMTQSELIKLQQDPASMVSKLGLPPGMQVNQLDVYLITPKQGAVAFESTIAPTTVDGVLNTTGGAKQTIVVDRNQFTPPIKAGSITVK